MLSERQERSLAAIENQLRLSDSRLASRFSLFAELVAGDEMPRREQLPLTLRARLARLARFPGSTARPTAAGWPYRVLLLLPVLLVTITCTVLLIITPSHGGCARPPVPEMVAGGPPAAQPAGWRSGCVPNQPSAAHPGTRPR